MSSSGGPTAPFTTLAISHPVKCVTHVELHRPEKLNAMNSAFWRQDSFLLRGYRWSQRSEQMLNYNETSDKCLD